MVLYVRLWTVNFPLSYLLLHNKIRCDLLADYLSDCKFNFLFRCSGFHMISFLNLSVQDASAVYPPTGSVLHVAVVLLHTSYPSGLHDMLLHRITQYQMNFKLLFCSLHKLLYTSDLRFSSSPLSERMEYNNLINTVQEIPDGRTVYFVHHICFHTLIILASGLPWVNPSFFGSMIALAPALDVIMITVLRNLTFLPCESVICPSSST